MQTGWRETRWIKRSAVCKRSVVFGNERGDNNQFHSLLRVLRDLRVSAFIPCVDVSRRIYGAAPFRLAFACLGAWIALDAPRSPCLSCSMERIGPASIRSAACRAFSLA